MSNYTTDKEKCYAHLSTEEREEIVAGLEQGESRRTIAKKLGGNPPRSAGKSGETPRF